MVPHFILKGVVLNWVLPGYTRLLREQHGLGDGVYKANICLFGANITVEFYNIETGKLQAASAFNDMDDFTRYFDVLDRRLLTEKTITLEKFRY